MTDPLGKTTTYTYDLVGDVIQKTDRLGRVTTYTYDADDRPQAEAWVGAAPPETITRSYDAAGRLTGISDADSRYTVSVR